MASRLRLPNRERSAAQMTIIEHLDELRSRIIKVGIIFFVAAIVAWFFRIQIYDALLAPAPSLHGKLYVTGITEQIVSDLKLALYAAFVVTVPVFLYQIWAFVAPAVGEVSRWFTYVLVAMASSLFLAGVAFSYFVVLPVGVHVLLTWAPGRYETIPTPTNYLAFVTRFLFAFGLVFELPAATYVAAKLGLVNGPLLSKYRRHAVVVNAVLAAALTPSPDPFSMLLMMGPMLGMYEISIIIARRVNPINAVTLPATLDDEDDEDL